MTAVSHGLAYGQSGKLVGTIYMLPLKDLVAQKSFNELPAPGGKSITRGLRAAHARHRQCRQFAELDAHNCRAALSRRLWAACNRSTLDPQGGVRGGGQDPTMTPALAAEMPELTWRSNYAAIERSLYGAITKRNPTFGRPLSSDSFIRAAGL
jgi:hypothetical protein